MEVVKTLIVEDEVIVARDLQRSLEKMGHPVASMVPSGEQAIEKIENEVPDLVLMDIELQDGMDGIETAELIHSRFDVPVIFLTAHNK
ncbi:MAG: response regulator [Candidatus Brocadiales bacterium]|nr:response regulator [Candidatus Brocadiales bacterium]